MTDSDTSVSPELGACGHCGAHLLYDDARYCPQCGNPAKKMTKDDVLSLMGCVFGGLTAFCFFMKGNG